VFVRGDKEADDIFSPSALTASRQCRPQRAPFVRTRIERPLLVVKHTVFARFCLRVVRRSTAIMSYLKLLQRK
jgi:hypothetical protein